MSEGKAIADRIQEDLIDYVVIKSEKVILLLFLFFKFHFRKDIIKHQYISHGIFIGLFVNCSKVRRKCRR